MSDGTVIMENWDEYLSITFLGVSGQNDSRNYTFNVRVKSGLATGEQEIAISEQRRGEYTIQLKKLLLGATEECVVQDERSPVKIIVRTRFKDTYEVSGIVPRGQPPQKSAGDAVTRFKFLVKPAFIRDLINLFIWCKTREDSAC